MFNMHTFTHTYICIYVCSYARRVASSSALCALCWHSSKLPIADSHQRPVACSPHCYAIRAAICFMVFFSVFKMDYYAKSHRPKVCHWRKCYIRHWRKCYIRCLYFMLSTQSTEKQIGKKQPQRTQLDVSRRWLEHETEYGFSTFRARVSLSLVTSMCAYLRANYSVGCRTDPLCRKHSAFRCSPD